MITSSLLPGVIRRVTARQCPATGLAYRPGCGYIREADGTKRLYTLCPICATLHSEELRPLHDLLSLEDQRSVIDARRQG